VCLAPKICAPTNLENNGYCIEPQCTTFGGHLQSSRSPTAELSEPLLSELFTHLLVNILLAPFRLGAKMFKAFLSFSQLTPTCIQELRE
jgi:hypothetical protein